MPSWMFGVYMDGIKARVRKFGPRLKVRGLNLAETVLIAESE